MRRSANTAAAAQDVRSSTSGGLAVARRPLHIAFAGILTVIGALLGYRAAEWYLGYLSRSSSALSSLATGGWAASNLVAVTLLGTLLGFLLASVTFRQIVALVPRIENLPVEDKVAGMIGVVLGLIVAVLLQPLVKSIPTFGNALVVLAYVFGVTAGVLVMVSMKKELVGMFASGSSAATDEEVQALRDHEAKPKLLDTNVIIDGRILDIWNSGFIEGELLVPQFVLDELQTIADSADDLKRARGRRGLELLNRMKDEVANFGILRARDYAVPVDDVTGVDQKLIRLATGMEASLITNDYNLNRVADVQGIPVLNVNRLAISLKPVVIAGEEMTVNIIRPGRDPGQGVAYLDDGTMVVVEDGEPKVGRVVDVVVNSLHQTVAGKMIFAQLKDGANHEHRRGGSSR
ncbi:MAG: TRAM domain-containing protein [Fimbriimonadaceae bacterium]|nr:TRAM domain-containing protein [Fimbriimonadaceae bacterium]